MGIRNSRYLRRIRQILTFSRSGWRPWDAWQLGLLGFARGHPLDSPDRLSRWLRSIYPSFLVRPAVLRGKVLELDGSDFTHTITFEEIFIEKTYDLKLVPFEPQAIIDCGAHVGMFTLLAATAYPKAKLVSFEPNPKNAVVLRRQMERNLLNMEVIEAAVSRADGMAWFAAEYSCGGSLQPSREAAPKGYQVKVVDFPKFVRDMGVSNLLLKMDIEGEEKNLVPELLSFLPRTCALFIETHHGFEGWQTMSMLLKGVGFTTGITRDRSPYVDGWAIRA